MATTRRFGHGDVDGAACLGAALIAGAAFWFGIWPVLHAEREAGRLTDQMSNSQTQLDATQTQYRELREAITGSLDRLEDIEIVLNTPDQLAARQADIGRVFAEFGLTVDQLNVGEIRQGKLLDTIPLRLSGTGDFPDLVRTMHEMRTVFPDMAVTAFQIGASGNAGQAGEPTIAFSLGLDWYVAGEGAGRG
ncbi:MAG: hypothetical protein IT431_16060 [Phycisphaerales bacterium]|nr:hypothetical protein [Phycisphaerales bacterium]